MCARCLESVGNLFSDLQISVRQIDLGSVETERELTAEQLAEVDRRLNEKGFELLRDRESELIERIRVHLLGYLRHLEESDRPEKLSVYVSSQLHYNYSYLSKLFSEQTGQTVETYLIRLKIERVKELLDYRNRTLSEIAWILKYSSVQYLSNQFKKVTGQTVTDYLRQGAGDRKALDRIEG